MQLPSGRKLFRLTLVKPSPTVSVHDIWQTERDARFETSDISTLADSTETDFALFSACEQHNAQPSSQHSFVSSRNAELQGLKNRGTFDLIDRAAVPIGTRIYGTRWVDTIKVIEGKEIEKSRLVAQNYRDKCATSISTKSPTVSRMGQRIAVTTATLSPEHVAYIRDISQSYLQSESNFERHVYLEPPQEMHLPKDRVPLVRKPLYGIPESGLHWYLTYHKHHTERLGMSACRSDPCLV